MKYLIILFSLITFSIFGQSGIEPTSLQGTPYQGGILVGVTPIIDEFTGDTIYLYQHSDTSFVKIDSLVYTDSLRLYTSQGVFTTYVSGGGGLSGSGVATRVAFWDGTSSLSSSANLYWDNVNDRLGIGNNSPLQRLHVTGSAIILTPTNQNTFINGGNQTLTGDNNVAIGDLSLNSVTTGRYNTSIGNGSLQNNLTGSHNFALGFQSIGNVSNAAFNVGIGYQSLANSNQQYNVAIGYEAGKNITSINNVIISPQGSLNSGSENVGIGSFSLSTNTGSQNIAIGTRSLSGSAGNNSIAIGVDALNPGGSNNIGIGNFTLGTINTSSSYNTAVGEGALRFINSNNNVALGSFAGDFSIGSNNLFLGYSAGRFSGSGNKLYIENSDSNTPLIGGHFDNNRVGINTPITDIGHTLDINGEVRIRDLTTTTPTKIMANDNDGVLSSLGLGTGINISGGNIVNTGIITEIDGDVDNEIQQIQKSGSNDVNIQITGGAGVGVESTLTNVLVPSNGSNGQILIKGSGTNYSWGDEIGDISNVTVSAPIVGGGVSGGVNIAIDTTSSTGVATQYDLTQIDQLQTISTSGTAGNITLSDGGGTLNLNVNDADADPANEFQTISKSGSTVTLSNGGGSFTDAVGPTYTAGTGIDLTGNVITNTVTSPQTWADVSGDVISWGTLGTFGSGKNVGIAATPTRDFDVNGDVRFRGAIYLGTSGSGSAGSIGQVLTSNGAGSASWTTPTLTEVDGSITNEGYQGVTAGSPTSSVIQGYNSAGTATGTGTTINVSGSLSISETTSTNGGQITLTGGYGAFTVAANGTAGSQVVTVDGTPVLNFNGGSNMEVTRSVDDFTFNSIVYYAQLSNNALITPTLDNTNRIVDFGIANETNNTQVDADITSNLITADVSGNYEVSYNLSYTLPTPALRDVIFKIYKAGSDIGYNYTAYSTHLSSTSSVWTPVSKTFHVFLTAGETIGLYYISSGSSTTINIASPVLSLKKLD